MADDLLCCFMFIVFHFILFLSSYYIVVLLLICRLWQSMSNIFISAVLCFICILDVVITDVA